MSNIIKELKAEIVRLARKEIKSELGPVKKINASQRGLIAGLRKQVASLQKEVACLKKAVPSPEKVLAAKTEPEGRFWITGKGVKTMRKRTGLTQAKFGKLVGVSVPTVVNWEKAEGKVNMRKGTAARLQEIKGMGKKQAAEFLGLGDAKEPKKSKAAAKAKGKAKPKTKAKLKTKAKPKARVALKAKGKRKAKAVLEKAPETPEASKVPEEKKD